MAQLIQLPTTRRENVCTAGILAGMKNVSTFGRYDCVGKQGIADGEAAHFVACQSGTLAVLPLQCRLLHVQLPQ